MRYGFGQNSGLVGEWGEPESSWLTTEVNRRRQEGLPVEDFITCNPWDFGYEFSPELLAGIFQRAVKVSGRYGADPLGRLPARESIAQWHGKGLAPERVLITPGTSMAYFYLFRLLAGSYGELLCPMPTYPLFDDLAQIAGLGVRRYHLHRRVTSNGTVRWVTDPDELRFQITRHTRAIVIVSPHNPTGTVLNADEMASVCEVANRAGLPVILDEVFRNYLADPDADVPRPAEYGAEVAFTLNGLSKSHYLPGMKLGWTAVEGSDTSCIQRMMNALEYMSDSFLPVSEITQATLPDLLGPAGLNESRRLASMQRSALQHRLANPWNGWQIDRPESGPYVCAPVTPDIGDSEESVVRKLLTNQGILLHPGSLYGMSEYLVGTVYNQTVK